MSRIIDLGDNYYLYEILLRGSLWDTESRWMIIGNLRDKLDTLGLTNLNEVTHDKKKSFQLDDKKTSYDKATMMVTISENGLRIGAGPGIAFNVWCEIFHISLTSILNSLDWTDTDRIKRLDLKAYVNIPKTSLKSDGFELLFPNENPIKSAFSNSLSEMTDFYLMCGSDRTNKSVLRIDAEAVRHGKPFVEFVMAFPVIDVEDNKALDSTVREHFTKASTEWLPSMMENILKPMIIDIQPQEGT